MEDLKILGPGERLREIRKILKIKQEELAGDTFCKNYISMFENNRRRINPINATYLADKINRIAREKGIDLFVSSAYFLKNEEDIAKEKCIKWLKQVEEKRITDNIEVNKILYKVILLSAKYSLVEFLGDALYLKGINSLENYKYNCALIQLMDAAIYFAKQDRLTDVAKAYESIGKALKMQDLKEQGESVLTLAESIANENDRGWEKLIEQTKRLKKAK
jgi:transcriptional regulator with XRE-family HTH domain